MVEVGTQTDIIMKLFMSRDQYLASLEQTTISEVNLKSDNNKVKFYAGLPSFKTLKAVYNFVTSQIPDHHRSVLTKFQQFCMVLVKLCLNSSDQDFWCIPVFSV